MLSIVFPYLNIAGYLGAIFFLGGFAALNLRWISSDSYTYQVANCLGGLCFTYSAFSHPFNIGLFITEGVWACIAAFSIYRISVKARKARTKEERKLS